MVYDEYDEINDTIVISPKKTLTRGCSQNFIYETHDSIMKMIQKHMHHEDLLQLKVSCARGNEMIDYEDIVDSMVRNMESTLHALCASVFNQKEECVRIIFTKYKAHITKINLFRMIMYLIFAKSVKMTHILLEYLDIPMMTRKYSNRKRRMFVFEKCYCNQTLECFQSYVVELSCNCNKCYVNNIEITSNMCMQYVFYLACCANNVETMRHIAQNYPIRISFDDVWTSLCNTNNEAILCLCNMQPGDDTKISQRTLRRFFTDIHCSHMGVLDKLQILEFLIDKGITFPGKRLINTVLTTCFWYRSYHQSEIDQFIKILNRYVQRKTVQSVFNQCVHTHVYKMVVSMINTCDNITFTNKHIRMMENDDLWCFVFPEGEEMVWNKMQLRARSKTM